MIDSEKQRRWWFANHPEYSNSRKGKHQHTSNEREEGQQKGTPESVDAYVDKALQHVDGTVAELLKSLKRNFSTAAEEQQNKAKSAVRTTSAQTGQDDHGGPRFRKYSNEELRRMGIPTPEEEALEADPHTYLDVVPYRRFLTAPVQSLKSVFWSHADDAILYWKKGDSVFELTTKGRVPAWSTTAQRYWKNESIKKGATQEWGAKNVERMRNGRAPQRRNSDTGEWESRELHHHPVPRRNGGRDFIPVWPQEHAAIDPQRRLKRR